MCNVPKTEDATFWLRSVCGDPEQAFCNLFKNGFSVGYDRDSDGKRYDTRESQTKSTQHQMCTT